LGTNMNGLTRLIGLFFVLLTLTVTAAPQPKILAASKVDPNVQAQPNPKAADLPFSSRAWECGAYNSSELNSMSQLELEGVYCTYRASVRVEAKREVEYKAGYAKHPENFEEALRFSRRLQQQCTREIKKTIEVLSQRFPGLAPDCSVMWKYISHEAAQDGQV
jgi:hypothetical protein